MLYPDLTNPQVLGALLQKHHLYTQKKFGQNFLIDPSVITESIRAANLLTEDVVVEIGAGAGVLTQRLADKAKLVHVFEIDQSLRPLLKETLGSYANIILHFQDFRHANLTELLADQPYKVVANLPYNAGTHILGQLIMLPHPPLSITVLLQKEVAQKITAAAPHATYLSNFVSLYGQASIKKIIGPHSFMPAPKVESAILHIEKKQIIDSAEMSAFSGLLHRGFANPRKKINKAFSVEELEKSGVDNNLRPENLSLDDWMRLYENVAKVAK